MGKIITYEESLINEKNQVYELKCSGMTVYRKVYTGYMSTDIQPHFDWLPYAEFRNVIQAKRVFEILVNSEGFIRG